MSGWQPITPLPPELVGQRSVRLVALAKQWAAERDAVRAQGRESALIEQLKNRMALETGILEGLYDIDRGVTETLIAEGFNAALLTNADTNRNSDLVIQILRDQRDAVDAVFDLVAHGRP